MIGGMIAATFVIQRLRPAARTRRCRSLLPAILVSLAVAMIGCGLLNATIERVAYKPLRGAPRLVPLITAIGVSFILENVAFIWKGSEPVSLPPSTLPTSAIFTLGTCPKCVDVQLGSALRPARHRAGPARARVARPLHAARQGDAGHGPGQGCRRDDGHRRQPDDLVHVPRRGRARRRGRRHLRASTGRRSSSTRASRSASSLSPPPCSAGSATFRAPFSAAS